MILWKYLPLPCSCPSSDARTERNALSSIRSATTGQTVTNPIRSYFNSHSKFCWQNYSTINHQFHPKLFLFSFKILAQLSKRSWNTAGPSVLTDLMRKTAVSAFFYLYHLEFIAKSLEKLKCYQALYTIHWSLQLDIHKNAHFSLHSPVLWSSNLSNSWIVFSFSSSQADLMNVICQIFNSISLLRPTAHLGLPPALLFVKKEKNFHTFSKLIKQVTRII